MTKAEKNRLKLYGLEIKYEQLPDQIKNYGDSKKDDKAKAIKEEKNCHVIFYHQMILVTVQTILELTMPGKNGLFVIRNLKVKLLPRTMTKSFI